MAIPRTPPAAEPIRLMRWRLSKTPSGSKDILCFVTSAGSEETLWCRVSQDFFVTVNGSQQGMARRNVAHAFPANQFGRHHELLGGQVWFLNPPQHKFGQMAAELFRKFAHRCKPGMQHFADGVIEARNTDVIGNSNSRFLQRLVNARRSLICACKKRGGLLSTGQ